MFLCSLRTIDKDTSLRQVFSGGQGLVLPPLLLDSPCHPSLTQAHSGQIWLVFSAGGTP